MTTSQFPQTSVKKSAALQPWRVTNIGKPNLELGCGYCQIPGHLERGGSNSGWVKFRAPTQNWEAAKPDSGWCGPRIWTRFWAHWGPGMWGSGLASFGPTPKIWKMRRARFCRIWDGCANYWFEILCCNLINPSNVRWRPQNLRS